MKLVIEIPESVKKAFDKATKDDIYGCYYDYNSLIGMAIKNGVPIEDAISRQAVLNTLDKMDDALDEDRTVETYKMLLIECVSVLPSVTPKQKMCFDGMTNGEVIKTLFPSCKTRRENTPMDNFMEFTLDGVVGYAIEKSWWNAPYKTESEVVE